MRNLTPELKCDVGVYVIQNEDTGHFYIGSGHLGRRYKYHQSALKNNTHDNSRFQATYNKNQNFVFIGFPIYVEQKVHIRNAAYEVEQLLLDENKDNPLLVNLVKEVEKGWFGLTHSSETKDILRQKLKDRWKDPEYRQRVIAAHNERIANISIEEKEILRQKYSIAQRARYKRAGFCPTKGQKRSDEFRKKNSANILEKWKDPEYREKQRKARLGRSSPIVKKEVLVAGVVYPSLTEAAKAFGLTKQGALGRIKSEKNKEWSYIKL